MGIPPGEQITELILTDMNIASGYTILFNIQQDVSGIVSSSGNYYSSFIYSGTALNTNILSENYPLTGGWDTYKGVEYVGTHYAILFYLYDL